MIKINYKKRITGFTLIELMVSLTVFTVVMVISMGSILSVLDDNHKSQTMRAVMDNLNFTLEGMTRTIRFGENYHCGSSGDITMPLDCPSVGQSILNVLDSDGQTITYSLDGTRISKIVVTGINRGTYYITSADVTITKLVFYVLGSSPYPPTGNTCATIGFDCLQPNVIVIMSGYSGTKPTTKTTFSLETTLSQRKLDLR